MRCITSLSWPSPHSPLLQPCPSHLPPGPISPHTTPADSPQRAQDSPQPTPIPRSQRKLQVGKEASADYVSTMCTSSLCTNSTELVTEDLQVDLKVLLPTASTDPNPWRCSPTAGPPMPSQAPAPAPASSAAATGAAAARVLGRQAPYSSSSSSARPQAAAASADGLSQEGHAAANTGARLSLERRATGCRSSLEGRTASSRMMSLSKPCLPSMGLRATALRLSVEQSCPASLAMPSLDTTALSMRPSFDLPRGAARASFETSILSSAMSISPEELEEIEAKAMLAPSAEEAYVMVAEASVGASIRPSGVNFADLMKVSGSLRNGRALLSLCTPDFGLARQFSRQVSYGGEAMMLGTGSTNASWQRNAVYSIGGAADYNSSRPMQQHMGSFVTLR